MIPHIKIIPGDSLFTAAGTKIVLVDAEGKETPIPCSKATIVLSANDHNKVILEVPAVHIGQTENLFMKALLEDYKIVREKFSQ